MFSGKLSSLFLLQIRFGFRITENKFLFSPVLKVKIIYK